MDLQGCLKGPDGIILMGLRNPKKNQHPVPQQPIDKTLVLSDDLFNPGKDLSGDLLHLLGLEPFGQGCVAGEIREQSGDNLTFRFGGENGDGLFDQRGR